MSVVIDASALVAFVTNEPASPAVAQLLDGWNSKDTPVNAPALARYEIVNALTKKAASSGAPPTMLPTSTSPATWAPSCGPSTARSPATPAPTATRSV